MITVGQVLKNKNCELVSVSPDDTVFEALKVMARRDIGAVLVMEQDKLEGLFTEREYARKVILEGKASKETRVAELMIHNLVIIHPDNSLEDCMALMTEKHIRYLPVVDGRALLGLISIGDVVKNIIAQQKSHLEDMEKYLTGDDYGFYLK